MLAVKSTSKLSQNISWFTLLGRADEIEEMGGTCGTYREEESTYRVLAWKSDGKRPLVGPRRRWENNINKDFKVIM